MTNSEYFEKNNISFTEALKAFNEQKIKIGGMKTFDQFLNSSYCTKHKFNSGDFMVMQLNKETRKDDWKHKTVFKVVGILDDYYEVYVMTPDSTGRFNHNRLLLIEYADRNCIRY